MTRFLMILCLLAVLSLACGVVTPIPASVHLTPYRHAHDLPDLNPASIGRVGTSLIEGGKEPVK